MLWDALLLQRRPPHVLLLAVGPLQLISFPSLPWSSDSFAFQLSRCRCVGMCLSSGILKFEHTMWLVFVMPISWVGCEIDWGLMTGDRKNGARDERKLRRPWARDDWVHGAMGSRWLGSWRPGLGDLNGGARDSLRWRGLGLSLPFFFRLRCKIFNCQLYPYKNDSHARGYLR